LSALVASIKRKVQQRTATTASTTATVSASTDNASLTDPSIKTKYMIQTKKRAKKQ
jgi:hypothetical protein